MEISINQPIAIGALGGSGTRIVAQILIESGIFLGNELNKSNDNLVFTRLFKSPYWLKHASTDQVFRRLRIFEKYMTRKKLNINDLKEFYIASKKNETFKTQNIYFLKFLLKSIINKNPPKIWGWKEPNSHIYIEYLSKFFKDLKYIHVVRHGLDMAFSDNKQQLFNWGEKFGVFTSKDEKLLPYYQLEYWIKSTKRIIEIANKFLGKRFYLLNFDEFCLNPEIEIPKLFDFLDIRSNEKKLKDLIIIPKSIGRYKKKDLSIFSKAQMKEVENLGFNL